MDGFEADGEDGVDGGHGRWDSMAANISSNNSYPTSMPTNFTDFNSTGNWTEPSFMPTCTNCSVPTSVPTSSPADSPTSGLSSIVGSRSFDTIAISLGLAFLLIIVAVTAIGYVQRCSFMRRSKLHKAQRGRASTRERLETYFTEDMDEDDVNSMARDIYTPINPSGKRAPYTALPTRVVTLSPEKNM